jgi:hypothetical protein
VKETIKPLDDGFGFGAEKITRYALDFARASQLNYENHLKKPKEFPKPRRIAPEPIEKQSETLEDSSPVSFEKAFKLRSANPIGYRVVKKQQGMSSKQILSTTKPLVKLSQKHQKSSKNLLHVLTLCFNSAHFLSCLFLILIGAQHVVLSAWFHEINEWIYVSQEKMLTMPGLELLTYSVQSFGLQNFTLLLVASLFFLFFLALPQSISYLWSKKSLGALFAKGLLFILDPIFVFFRFLFKSLLKLKWKN